MRHKHKRKGFPIAYGLHDWVKQILTTAAVESMETDNENFYVKLNRLQDLLFPPVSPNAKLGRNKSKIEF